MPKKKVCSFCGRSEDEVRLLITGVNGFICDSCIQQAYDIAQEMHAYDSEGGERKPFQLKKVPKPVEIKNIWMSISSGRMRLNAIFR